MPIAGAIPLAAAISVSDMLDNCAAIKAGQHVVIVAAIDGLYGGQNLVDEPAVAWVQAGVQQRGAHATVVWTDMPARPALI